MPRHVRIAMFRTTENQMRKEAKVSEKTDGEMDWSWKCPARNSGVQMQGCLVLVGDWLTTKQAVPGSKLSIILTDEVLFFTRVYYNYKHEKQVSLCLSWDRTRDGKPSIRLE